MRFRRHKLPVKADLVEDKKVKTYHIPDWRSLDEQGRLAIIRQIAMSRGRDPRIVEQAIKIIKKAKVKPRDYKGQAAALLKWVQDNVYYVNEPGERLQDPIYTLKKRFGDCDDMTILLASFLEAVNLPWRLVLFGKCGGGQKVRYIEGEPYVPPCAWTHIYLSVGDRPFKPQSWHYAEPTVKGAPLGWDVVDGDPKYMKDVLPEIEDGESKARTNGASGKSAFVPSSLSFSSPVALAAVPVLLPVHGNPSSTSALVPLVGNTAGTLTALGMQDGSSEEDKKAPLIDWRKVLPSIVTGVSVSLGTQFILSLFKPKA